MKRRSFIKKAAVGGALGASTGLLSSCAKEGVGPAVHTQPNIRWRLASSFPRSLDTIFGAADTLSHRLKELTDGRFILRIHPAGELLPPLQVLDGVQNGNAEMGHSAGYYYIGKNPALAFDTSLPFGLTARQQSAWLMDGGGLDLMRSLYADFNVVNFSGGNTGTQMGGWFRKPVRNLAELKGLKMRIPGMGGEVMSRLGVNVQVIAGGDIYPALERGAIDATEWVGPYDDLKLGFHQVAKNYYYPGWWEPGPALSFYVNKAAWESLPSSYQAALEAASAEASFRMMTQYDAKNPQALKTLQGHGVRLHAYSDDILDAASKMTNDIVRENSDADAAYKKIYAQWDAFRQASSSWFGTAEQRYARYAFK